MKKFFSLIFASIFLFASAQMPIFADESSDTFTVKDQFTDEAIAGVVYTFTGENGSEYTYTSDSNGMIEVSLEGQYDVRIISVPSPYDQYYVWDSNEVFLATLGETDLIPEDMFTLKPRETVITVNSDVTNEVNQLTQNTNTFSITDEKIDISGTITWNDHIYSSYRRRPDTITIDLYAGDALVDTQILDSSSDTTYTFAQRDRYQNGIEIDYTVKERDIDHYEINYSGYDITNVQLVKLTIDITFGDNDNAEGIRPDEFTFGLYRSPARTDMPADFVRIDTYTVNVLETTQLEVITTYVDGDGYNYAFDVMLSDDESEEISPYRIIRRLRVETDEGITLPIFFFIRTTNDGDDDPVTPTPTPTVEPTPTPTPTATPTTTPSATINPVVQAVPNTSDSLGMTKWGVSTLVSLGVAMIAILQLKK